MAMRIVIANEKSLANSLSLMEFRESLKQNQPTGLRIPEMWGKLEPLFGARDAREFRANESELVTTFHFREGDKRRALTVTSEQFYVWSEFDRSQTAAVTEFLDRSEWVAYHYEPGRPVLAGCEAPLQHRRQSWSGNNDFRKLQTHLDASPAGIGVDEIGNRKVCGDVWGGDIEFGWTTEHQEFLCHFDMDGKSATISDPNNYADHGTAAIGLGVAALDTVGSVGIAPQTSTVKCFAISDNPTSRGQLLSVAVKKAANALRPGDVLMIQVQMERNPDKLCEPVEVDPDVLHQIRVATKERQIIVVEPAGNSALNLDKLSVDLVRNDSGAIVVGAAIAPAAPETKWVINPSSNFGTRLDTFAQGLNVCTTGYGDLAVRSSRGADWYTTKFGGTSSATAIVWGMCLLLQQIAKGAERDAVAPADMRAAFLASTHPPKCPDLKDVIQTLGM